MLAMSRLQAGIFGLLLSVAVQAQDSYLLENTDLTRSAAKNIVEITSQIRCGDRTAFNEGRGRGTVLFQVKDRLVVATALHVVIPERDLALAVETRSFCTYEIRVQEPAAEKPFWTASNEEAIRSLIYDPSLVKELSKGVPYLPEDPRLNDIALLKIPITSKTPNFDLAIDPLCGEEDPTAFIYKRLISLHSGEATTVSASLVDTNDGEFWLAHNEVCHADSGSPVFVKFAQPCARELVLVGVVSGIETRNPTGDTFRCNKSVRVARISEIWKEIREDALFQGPEPELSLCKTVFFTSVISSIPGINEWRQSPASKEDLRLAKQYADEILGDPARCECKGTAGRKQEVLKFWSSRTVLTAIGNAFRKGPGPVPEALARLHESQIAVATKASELGLEGTFAALMESVPPAQVHEIDFAVTEAVDEQ